MKSPLSKFPLAAFLAILGASCQLPDITPFAEGVAAVDLGVRQVGASVQEDFEHFLPPGDAQIKEIQDQWQVRIAASNALVHYANSLEALVASGNTGKEAATRLANEVSHLVKTDGLSELASNTLFQVGAEIYDLYGRMAALDSLEEAVGLAHEAIVGVCDVLVLDLKTIESSMENFQLSRIVALKTDSYIEDKKSLEGLEELRLSEIGKMQDSNAGDASQIARLDSLIQIIGDVEKRVRLVEDDLKVLQNRYQGNRTAVQQTIAALREVKAAHAELQSAIANNEAPSMRNLMYAADAITQTMGNIKTIRSQDNE